MLKILNERQRQQLKENGFVAPIRVFSEEKAQAYRACLEAFELSASDAPPEETLATLSRFKPHLLFTWLDEICHNQSLLDAIEDLIGPDLLIYSTAFFIKNAGDNAYVPWHQDTAYADFKGGKQVRAWTAFTNSNKRNGCMRVIKGSHLRRLSHKDDPLDENNILFRKERLSEDIDETLAADLILKPGEMSVHDYGVVHGSEGNNSDDRRIGFAIAFITPDTKPVGRKETAMLVKGSASEADWELEPRPKRDLDQRAKKAHRHAMKIRTGHFYNTKGTVTG